MTQPLIEFTAMVAERGYVVLYQRQASNACPGCGGSNWFVARLTAECAFCGTALPIAQPVSPEHLISPEL